MISTTIDVNQSEWEREVLESATPGTRGLLGGVVWTV